MEKLLYSIKELDICEGSIEIAPFQGEMCTVFHARSNTYGELVIKTALRAMQLSEEGQNEIQQNKEGYGCIPSGFRPEIFASDRENTFLVMPNVGKPLRDLLWENQNSPETSERIVGIFLENLSRLLRNTKTQDIEARNVFLNQLQKMGQIFLQSDFFPSQLREKFIFLIDHLRQSDDSAVSFATLDLTQGNLLINTKHFPNTLKVIDPKKPRLVGGRPTFLGISEVDLGMFFITLSLNAPEAVQNLRIEDRLKIIGHGLRDNVDMSNFSFELGKLFGCILVASFPNSLERVGIYLRSLGVNYDDDIKNLVIMERERHVQKAIKITDCIDINHL